MADLVVNSAIPRPVPRVAQRIHLSLPNLPPAMEGATILHVSDLHVRRYRPWYRRLITMASHERPDFVCMTGDYMSNPGNEQVAMRVLSDLVAALRPRHGIYASFGNHDSEAFKRLADTIESVVWLEQEAIVLPEFGITFLGTSTPCDLIQTLREARRREADGGWGMGDGGGATKASWHRPLACARAGRPCHGGSKASSAVPSHPAPLPQGEGGKASSPRHSVTPFTPPTPDMVPTRPAPPPYRILLAHEPSILIACAELGIEWALLGHTHGGQIRLGVGPPMALHNNTDLPLSHSSGILRCRDSVGTISRGLGESYFDVRWMCPPQLPLYILRRGVLPGGFSRRLSPVHWW